uniref:Secreted protein n=1 Tax=Knipowitschia caucasica TaxID=637954 RepID=A0AAV2MFQ9_KNICA
MLRLQRKRTARALLSSCTRIPSRTPLHVREGGGGGGCRGGGGGGGGVGPHFRLRSKNCSVHTGRTHGHEHERGETGHVIID